MEPSNALPPTAQAPTFLTPETTEVNRMNLLISNRDLSDSSTPTPPLATLNPILAQGMVVDGFGIAVRNVSVQLEKGDSEKSEWKSIEGFSATTQSDGSFTIQGSVTPGHYRLTFDHEDFLETNSEINLGEKGLELQLRKPWTINGLVLLDEELTDESFNVSLLPTSPSSNWNGRLRFYLSNRNGYMIKNVPDGNYTLVLRESGCEVPLLSKPLFLSPEGGKKDQLDLDLRGIVNRITLTILDSDEVLVTGCWASTLDGERLAASRSSPITFLTKEPFLDLEVGAQGCRNIVVEDVNGDMEIRLPPGIEVQVFLNEAPEIPEGWHWFCELGPVDSDQVLHPFDGNQLFLDDTQCGTARVPHPGDYRLRVYLADLSNPDLGARGFKMPETIGNDSKMPVWHVLETEKVQAYYYSMTQKQVEKSKAVLRKIKG